MGGNYKGSIFNLLNVWVSDCWKLQFKKKKENLENLKFSSIGQNNSLTIQIIYDLSENYLYYQLGFVFKWFHDSERVWEFGETYKSRDK